MRNFILLLAIVLGFGLTLVKAIPVEAAHPAETSGRYCSGNAVYADIPDNPLTPWSEWNHIEITQCQTGFECVGNLPVPQTPEFERDLQYAECQPIKLGGKNLSISVNPNPPVHLQKTTITLTSNESCFDQFKSDDLQFPIQLKACADKTGDKDDACEEVTTGEGEEEETEIICKRNFECNVEGLDAATIQTTYEDKSCNDSLTINISRPSECATGPEVSVPVRSNEIVNASLEKHVPVLDYFLNQMPPEIVKTTLRPLKELDPKQRVEPSGIVSTFIFSGACDFPLIGGLIQGAGLCKADYNTANPKFLNASADALNKSITPEMEHIGEPADCRNVDPPGAEGKKKFGEFQTDVSGEGVGYYASVDAPEEIIKSIPLDPTVDNINAYGRMFTGSLQSARINGDCLLRDNMVYPPGTDIGRCKSNIPTSNPLTPGGTNTSGGTNPLTVSNSFTGNSEFGAAEFTNEQQQWINQILTNSSNAKLVNLVNQNASNLIIRPYTPTNPRTANEGGLTIGCTAPKTGEPIINIYPKGANATEAEFKYTLLHELGHVLYYCADNNVSLAKGEGGFENIWNAKAGPTVYGTRNVVEGYAEMIAFYLQPTIGSFTINWNTYPQMQELAKKILGS